MNQNYLWFSSFGIVILIIGSIGLIWGYLLSITSIKLSILRFKKYSGVRGKLIYWLLNMCFWVTFLVLIMAYYFFIVWYVMNPDAIENNIIIPSYIRKKNINTDNNNKK